MRHRPGRARPCSISEMRSAREARATGWIFRRMAISSRRQRICSGFCAGSTPPERRSSPSRLCPITASAKQSTIASPARLPYGNAEIAPCYSGVRRGKFRMIAGLLALVAASAFFGASLYINIVEQPARMSLDSDAMLKEWKPSDHRGLVMLALFAVLSGALGFIAFARTADLRWLIGTAIVLASWPYAFFVIVPL